MARAGQKDLDLIQQRVAIAFEVTMVRAHKLDELRARDVLRHVARVRDVDHLLRRAVQNERRHANGGEHVPHVDLTVHLHDREAAPGLADARK